MSRGTANADGVIASGHGHFTHAVKVWRPDFTQIVEVTDFLTNDEVQYWSQCDLYLARSEVSCLYLTRFRMRYFLRGVFLGDFVDEQEWQWDIRKEADHGMVAD